MNENNPFSLENFCFDLPPELIAQHPAPSRRDARLLVYSAEIDLRHQRFSEILQFLEPGDVLVLNQTKVIKARCFAQRKSGGQIEVFFLGMPADPHRATVLLRPAKRVQAGERLVFPQSGLEVTCLEKAQGQAVLDCGNFEQLRTILDQDGQIPLPPYIKRQNGFSSEDESRYQTVFARDPGAVAAPTAGLHFDEALLNQLRNAGIEICFVTHHVGIGTFKPVSAQDVREHQMESEHYFISDETAGLLNAAKLEGRRIIAVGTTSTRCLESNFSTQFQAGQFDTRLFIYPGYTFQAIDGLITNFHLPGSSLILLVSALIGRESVMNIYQTAIANKYRFYSYGDAMLLLPKKSAGSK
ncbi:MAG: tRNA preQ1(34) S-adenosylmethionine ribosyltransferase-isomerase QueA [Acidobacteria bacterium]|nr:tRNA preQ1(34) S-adenosylmethionine ribosyltransferase-isomerase QueA [Acidobacteriota bacterium]MCB9396313.1 tRNA preQ1(34) S-adenosylmethionine ribosyltransferase-isomerase QueA [Acidobacteriota bacterium]